MLVLIRQLTLIGLFSISNSSQAQAVADILGVKIGSEKNFALQSIQSQLPAFKSKTINYWVPEKHNLVSFSLDPDARTSEQVVVGVAQNNRVWFLGRAICFEVGKRPSYEDMYAALIGKYGAPSFRPVQRRSYQKGGDPIRPQNMIWVFNALGSQQDFNGAEGNRRNPCSETGWRTDVGDVTSSQIMVPGYSGKDCGVVILAQTRFDSYSNTITSLSVTITEGQIMLHDPLLGAETRKEIARVEALRMEPKVGKPPKL